MDTKMIIILSLSALLLLGLIIMTVKYNTCVKEKEKLLNEMNKFNLEIQSYKQINKSLNDDIMEVGKKATTCTDQNVSLTNKIADLNLELQKPPIEIIKQKFNNITDINTLNKFMKEYGKINTYGVGGDGITCKAYERVCVGNPWCKKIESLNRCDVVELNL